MLEFVMNHYCIDMSMIWAGGFSNGAMFGYELAHDPRTSKLLAGLVPTAGLPHWGFNHGPNSTISIHAFWGLYDDTCPPMASAADDGSFNETRSSQIQGWFFTTADAVT